MLVVAPGGYSIRYYWSPTSVPPIGPPHTLPYAQSLRSSASGYSLVPTRSVQHFHLLDIFFKVERILKAYYKGILYLRVVLGIACLSIS